ncbi:hypothetical protein GCM10025869_34910 [Homoserinibacter gongjuensis]|uniref:Uncharacterized protein n=1 Tax=Homoserinibacter gongjuensis TaxID=1162968 RepID=A0ABQ6JZ83_9MICO|nr:hypothetical protein GCM10025869_34910 [Homoserinibacter gongjuensis]
MAAFVVPPRVTPVARGTLLGMVTFPSPAHTHHMEECRHGLIAAVCAVCCRAVAQLELEATAAQQAPPPGPELAVAGGAVPR